jgi:hypothetical protein
MVTLLGLSRTASLFYLFTCLGESGEFSLILRLISSGRAEGTSEAVSSTFIKLTFSCEELYSFLAGATSTFCSSRTKEEDCYWTWEALTVAISSAASLTLPTAVTSET